jgi:hypothetical protein
LCSASVARLSRRSDIVLAAVLEYGELPEILRVSDMLRDRLAQRVVVFFAKPHYRRIAEDTAEVIARGHTWMDCAGEVHNSPAVAHPLEVPAADGAPRVAEPQTNASQALPPALTAAAAAIGSIFIAIGAALTGVWRGFKNLLVDAINAFADAQHFRARARTIEQILTRLRPSLVVLAQEPVGTELAFISRAASRLDIRSLLVPFAMFNLRELAEYAHARDAHQLGGRPLNLMLALLCPRWTARFRDRTILRLPGPRALALECTGLVNGNPWHPFSGLVDIAACDSRVSRQKLITMGLPPARLHVVGAPVHDRLAAHLKQGRKEFDTRHGLVPDRPLVTCGWPVNMFEWRGGGSTCYSDYRSLAQAWASALAEMREKHGVEILLSVHPKTLDSELREAAARDLRVVRGDSEALVAHCDVFTTLNGSSLTAWAIACSKPVVLFDCFQTGYTDFDAAPGCRMTHREADFVAELDRLCGDAKARLAMAEAQRSVAADWGILDGRASERLAALASILIDDERRPGMSSVAMNALGDALECRMHSAG